MNRPIDIIPVPSALGAPDAGVAGFGITLDLDVFPPAEAPGVSTPAPGGQAMADWSDALRGLAELTG
jgi:arginase family enzyme